MKIRARFHNYRASDPRLLLAVKVEGAEQTRFATRVHGRAGRGKGRSAFTRSPGVTRWLPP